MTHIIKIANLDVHISKQLDSTFNIVVGIASNITVMTFINTAVTLKCFRTNSQIMMKKLNQLESNLIFWLRFGTLLIDISIRFSNRFSIIYPIFTSQMTKIIPDIFSFAILFRF